MTEPDLLILDASVALKWVLRLADEEHLEYAEQLRADHRDGRVRLLTPEHFRAEVGHALVRAVRRGRVSLEDGADGLDDVSSLSIPTFRHSGVMAGAWRLAHRYGCSFYDAGYLALAAMTGAPFVHADGKLRTTLRGRFPYELWLTNYSSGMNNSS